MTIERDSLVVVQSGGMHCVGRIIDPSDRPGVWWVDVNILSQHLPQMYRTYELTEVGPPSSVLIHGLCPSCRGYGLVHKVVPVAGEGPCSACGGSGRIGVEVQIDEAPNETIGHIRFDADRFTGIKCDLCREAATPRAR